MLFNLQLYTVKRFFAYAGDAVFVKILHYQCATRIAGIATLAQTCRETTLHFVIIEKSSILFEFCISFVRLFLSLCHISKGACMWLHGETFTLCCFDSFWKKLYCLCMEEIVDATALRRNWFLCLHSMLSWVVGENLINLQSVQIKSETFIFSNHLRLIIAALHITKVFSFKLRVFLESQSEGCLCCFQF